MLGIGRLVLVVVSSAHVSGTNIMLSKPSVQSGTHIINGVRYPSQNANDGMRTGSPSMTKYHQDPYWQGDLQAFYTVTSISISSATWHWAKHLRKAFVGVSIDDNDCSESQVTKCGQWPDQTLSGHTLAFNCSNAGPVRFVRIWREGNGHLCLGEVEVEGTPSRLTGAVYDKVMLQKIITQTTSLSVTSATGCGTICHRTHDCLAFSYSSSEQPNCLLATDDTMTADVKWVSYKVGMCVQFPTCDVSGFL